MRACVQRDTVPHMRIAAGRPAGPPRALAFDAPIVVALTALYEYQVWAQGTVDGPRWLTAVAVPLLIDLPLLWRRTDPLLALTQSRRAPGGGFRVHARLALERARR